MVSHSELAIDNTLLLILALLRVALASTSASASASCCVSQVALPLIARLATCRFARATIRLAFDQATRAYRQVFCATVHIHFTSLIFLVPRVGYLVVCVDLGRDYLSATTFFRRLGNLATSFLGCRRGASMIVLTIPVASSPLDTTVASVAFGARPTFARVVAVGHIGASSLAALSVPTSRYHPNFVFVMIWLRQLLAC